MSRSISLFAAAQQVIPGGVNSPVRAFKNVGGSPIFFKKGQGAYLIDEDERHYIDYVGSWGTAIVGHAHPDVVAAVQQAVANGLSFGAPTAAEVEIAQKICQHFDAIDNVRLVSSGTEATMSAIRLARGVTGRNKILKFAGCYHGHCDALLVAAGSGALTFGVPSSPGVSAATAADTLVATYNDLATATAIFAQFGTEIAAVIVEPVAGNMNCVLPQHGFLAGLRSLCDDYNSLLIFDEVMTGFRVGLPGAQQLFAITPDLTTLGKVIGGGMPLAAFGGKKEIMQHLAPVGPVYQAGTLSGNPVAVAAGLATLKCVEEKDFYLSLAAKTQYLVEGLLSCAQAHGLALTANYVGGMFGLFFSAEKNITQLEQVMRVNLQLFQQFFFGMLKRGIYFAPSAYEAGFMSAAHSYQDLDATLAAAEQVFSELHKAQHQTLSLIS